MDVHGVVDHVRHAQKLDLGLQDVVVLVETAFLEEFEQGEDEVAVEMRGDSRGEVVARHGSALGFWFRARVWRKRGTLEEERRAIKNGSRG